MRFMVRYNKKAKVNLSLIGTFLIFSLFNQANIENFSFLFSGKIIFPKLTLFMSEFGERHNFVFLIFLLAVSHSACKLNVSLALFFLLIYFLLLLFNFCIV